MAGTAARPVPATPAGRVAAPAAGGCHFLCSSGTAVRRFLVYGCRGLPNTFTVSPISTIAPWREDDRAVAHVVAERQVVGDEQDRQAGLLQADEQVQDVDPGGGVQHADDLVGDQQPDVEEQGTGDEQALLLATGQLMRVLAEDITGIERDGGQRRLDLVLPGGLAGVREVHAAEQLEDALGPFGIKVLRIAGRRQPPGEERDL